MKNKKYVIRNEKDYDGNLSLLRFLRSLPTDMDDYRVDLISLTVVYCDVCGASSLICEDPISRLGMVLADFRKDAPDDACEYLHHLIYPHLFDCLMSEFDVHFRENKIVIEYLLYDLDHLSHYVCDKCRRNV